MNLVVKTGLVLGGLMLLAACGEPTEYNDGIKRTFMDACVEGAGGIDVAEEICGCTYDSLVEDVPFNEFKEIDRAMSAGTATAEQQQVLVGISLACVAKVTS